MYESLRKYIETLDCAGELIRVGAKVSSQYEIAEITDRMAKSANGGKALLFENTDTEFPVVTNIMGSERRMAMALGVDNLDDLTKRIDSLVKDALSPKNTFTDKLRMLPLLGEISKWFPKISTRKGACQQVVRIGDEAKLSLIPILKCWPYDGGRFITLPMVNTIDPDSGARNVGMYRMQVFDDYTTGMHWHCHKTGARHYEAYKARGERMPVAVALGGDPVYSYCATAPMPDNMDEYLLAGFLRRKAVRLVKCLTNNIYVPEDCDFVIEGYVDTSEEPCIEGDFGDHTGFYSLKDLYPKFHVTAITHRRDAIYPATIVGIPPQEDAAISKATERIFLTPIRLAIQPEIVDLTMPEAGVSHNLACISLHSRYTGQATKVAQSLWGAGQMMFNKYMILTSPNCNIRSPKCIAALIRGCDMNRNIIRSEGIYDVLDHATATCGYGGKLAIDLTGVQQQAVVTALPTEYILSEAIVATKNFDEWSCIAVFIKCGKEFNAAKFLTDNSLECKALVTFDESAKDLTDKDLLWLATANSDPRRDVVVLNGCVAIDARPKLLTCNDFPLRWPNVVVSSEQTIELVDNRWNEYGIGDLRQSPSRLYRQLLLSQQAEA